LQVGGGQDNDDSLVYKSFEVNEYLVKANTRLQKSPTAPLAHTRPPPSPLFCFSFCLKRSTGHKHTHTPTDREQHPRHRHTHTHNKNNTPNPQTNTPHKHLTTLEGGNNTYATQAEHTADSTGAEEAAGLILVFLVYVLFGTYGWISMLRY